MTDGFDAIVLAGGAARRLGGEDKAALLIRGRSLLDRVLDACATADRIVVVGPRRSVVSRQDVVWAREEPAGAGPVAAIAAGLREATAALIVVLACDLPYVTTAALEDLLSRASAVPGRDGAIFVDAASRDQPLVGAYRRAALIRALDALTPPHAGTALRALLEWLDLERVPDRAGVTRDCDTWDEVEVARRAQ